MIRIVFKIINMSYSLNSSNLRLFKNLNKKFGVGKSTAKLIFKQLGFSNNLLIDALNSEQVDNLNRQILFNNVKTDQELKKIISKTLEKLVAIKSRKGLRKLKGYPVRGQRTHSNASTCRNRKYF